MTSFMASQRTLSAVDLQGMKALFFRTTSSDMEDRFRAPEGWQRSTSMKSLREQVSLSEGPRHKESAQDPKLLTYRVLFEGRPCVDFEINRHNVETHTKRKRNASMPSLEQSSSSQRFFQGASAERRRSARPDAVDMADLDTLQDLFSGKQWVTASTASTRHAPPAKGHPTRGSPFTPQDHLGASGSQAHFWTSRYKLEHNCSPQVGSDSRDARAATAPAKAWARTRPPSAAPLPPAPAPDGKGDGAWLTSTQRSAFQDPTRRVVRRSTEALGRGTIAVAALAGPQLR
eukprot:TRINITY_DN32885_c0_g1_i1.p1 TRINITY_DN32885_c0_g1~~TRINITY_DN32885_c0_g1_i1.p1  ORF type:complete len:313 (-),score=38.11 TRINITY_DN32885_c0_g1_i1:16-879(-)